MATFARLRDEAGETWSLQAVDVTIGRDRGCEIPVEIPAVSRRHATIRRSPHGWSIRDLGSSNGTWVNGERAPQRFIPLRDGDEIVLAGSVSLLFDDPQTTPLAPAIGRLTGVWIDAETNAVWVDAQPVEPPLSMRQQLLVELLENNLGQVVTREDVVAHVWSDVAAEGVSAEAIDALIKRVRERIRPLQRSEDWLEVVRARGIRMIDPDAS